MVMVLVWDQVLSWTLRLDMDFTVIQKYASAEVVSQESKQAFNLK
jgi:hypothetical protein